MRRLHDSKAVLSQRFQSDAYFTAEQGQRLRELLDCRTALTMEERAELEAFIDAELEATVARTDSLVPQPSNGSEDSMPNEILETKTVAHDEAGNSAPCQPCSSEEENLFGFASPQEEAEEAELAATSSEKLHKLANKVRDNIAAKAKG